MHSEEALLEAYFPAAQDRQEASVMAPVVFRKVPSGQSRHMADPTRGPYFPLGHAWHSIWPGKLLYLPTAQGVYSDVLSPGQALPEGHSMHLLDPVAGAYVLGGHALHDEGDVAFIAAPYLPASH